MSVNLELVTDALLALLLLVTIGYAVVLNRKLATLRNLRGEMERVFADFSETTRTAETSVADLRQRAEVLSGELKAQVTAASSHLEELRSLNEDLRFLVEKGQPLADRLEQAVAERHKLAESAAVNAANEPTPQRRERGNRGLSGMARLSVPASAIAAATAAAQPAEEGPPADRRRRDLINALDAIR